MKIIHIVPTGFNKTLCGLNARTVNETSCSLGITCNCNNCLAVASTINRKFMNTTKCPDKRISGKSAGVEG